MELTGAEIIWECLLREGVEIVFGYPGGAILPTYDALSKYQDRVRHVLVRHEQGATHMADGYARITGKVGVAMATSGPGATNMVTGIATAMMDSVPLVCITGQVPSTVLGSDAFQETDITGITLPITKHNFLVTNVKQIAPALRKAFHIARTAPWTGSGRYHQRRSESENRLHLPNRAAAPARLRAALSRHARSDRARPRPAQERRAPADPSGSRRDDERRRAPTAGAG